MTRIKETNPRRPFFCFIRAIRVIRGSTLCSKPSRPRCIADFLVGENPPNRVTAGNPGHNASVVCRVFCVTRDGSRAVAKEI